MDLGLGSLQRIVFRTGRHEVVGWLHLLVFISNLNHTLGEFGFWVGGRGDLSNISAKTATLFLPMQLGLCPLDIKGGICARVAHVAENCLF